MALLFFDSFDHYTIASDKWANQRNQTGTTLQTGTGRSGSAFWAFNGRYLTKILATNYATLIVGFAFKTPSNQGSYGVLAFKDSTTLQTELTYNFLTGLWAFTRNGTALGSVVSPIPASGYSYVEVKVTFHGSTGAITHKINGNTVLALTNQNTSASGNAFAGIFVLGDWTDGTPDSYFDDFYICDTSGSSPTNDFLGDSKVECLYPNGNGNSSQMVGSDADSTNNYLLVDEATPNSDTDYVESSTVGNKDTYTYGDLTSTSGTVYGVQCLPYAKKTDAGTRSIVTIARLSATEVDSAAATLGSGYTYAPDIRETKPGGGAWSITDVNNAEFGVKVNA